MSRKEKAKNVLGISYYPWSSDEEEDDETNDITTDDNQLVRQLSEPGISAADMSGTSGESAERSPTGSTHTTLPTNQQGPLMSEAARRTLLWLSNDEMSTSRDAGENTVQNTPSSHNSVIPDTVPNYADTYRLYQRPCRLTQNRLYSYNPSRYPRSNRSIFSYPQHNNYNLTREEINIRAMSENVRLIRMMRNRRIPIYNTEVGTAMDTRSFATPDVQLPTFPRRLTSAPVSANIDLDLDTTLDTNILGGLDVQFPTFPQRMTSAPVGDNNENMTPSIQPPAAEQPGVNLDHEALDVNRDREEAVQVDQAQTTNSPDEPVAMDDEVVVIDEGDADAQPDAVVRHPEPNANGQEGNEIIQIEDDTCQIVKQEVFSEPEEPDHFTTKEFNENLLKLLECPVCLEWMEPPMLQCRRGHLVCNGCRVKLTTCPVCRSVFSSMRNRAMENVACMVRYPCRHACGREVPLRRRSSHEGSCPSRRYNCPAPSCVALRPLNLIQLRRHFQTMHPPMLKLGSKNKFVVKLEVMQHAHWMVMSLQQMFHVHFDMRKNGLFVFVAYIGPKRNAVNYIYKVTVLGYNKARKIVWTRCTHCDLENPEQIVNNQDCFCLSIEQARSFLSVGNRRSRLGSSLKISVDLIMNIPTKKHTDDK